MHRKRYVVHPKTESANCMAGMFSLGNYSENTAKVTTFGAAISPGVS